MAPAAQQTSEDALLARVAQLEAALSAERAERAAERETSEALRARLEKDVEVLRASHERLRQELELLRHRIFVAKAERLDSKQLELEFAAKLAALDELAGKLPTPATDSAPASSPANPGGDGPAAKPRGRRDLRGLKLPEVRVEINDPVYEQLVAEGKAARLPFEESYKLAWQRGGQRKLVIARAKYKTLGDDDPMFDTAPVPAELLPRALAAPSMLAHIVHEKFGRGLPFYRLETGFRRDGVPIDRGTMARWLEELGGALGASIVEAARKEALASAFCISTDATGVAVQPERTSEKKRQPCRRGHFFVQIADRDHVFFEYAPKETSAAVASMFDGFTGYVQADAKSVFDILFRPPPTDADESDGDVATEVGCMAHARRKFWEAAVTTKSPVAREAVFRIRRLYQNEELWRGKPPDEIARLRQQHTRPELEAFFAWATVEHDKVRGQRGWLRRAFGYATRQKAALMRFLDDGRLNIDNTASERELRQIAVGRKAWLFVGSDDHATSAANLLSLIASARLHGLDPEEYLRDVFRVLPHWPNDRHLELAPKYWRATRARLDARELAADLGPLSVPPQIAANTAPEQQPASD